MITYLFSNISINNIFDNQFITSLKEDVVEFNKITFIPTSFDDQQKTKKYEQFYHKYLKQNDVFFTESTILSKCMKRDEIINHLITSDVVWLMGGNTIEQREFLSKNNLFEVINALNNVVIGISAGAINLCLVSLLTNEHPSIDVYITKGIGRVKLTVEVHYDPNDQLQQDLLEVARDQIDEIYCLNDQTYLRIFGKDITVVGERIIKK